MSGYQDSNLGPPAPKAGALTGLRYTPLISQLQCKDTAFFYTCNTLLKIYRKKLSLYFACINNDLL